MDPLGLALEHFDGVGKWRALDESGAPIDASGALPDGRKFDGADGLRTALLTSDRFITTLSEKMLRMRLAAEWSITTCQPYEPSSGTRVATTIASRRSFVPSSRAPRSR